MLSEPRKRAIFEARRRQGRPLRDVAVSRAEIEVEEFAGRRKVWKWKSSGHAGCQSPSCGTVVGTTGGGGRWPPGLRGACLCCGSDLTVVANNPQTLACLGNHPRSLVKCRFPVANLETLFYWIFSQVIFRGDAPGTTIFKVRIGWSRTMEGGVGGWKGVWDTWCLWFRKIKNSVSHIHCHM